jgi:hypothetical protein
MFNHLVLSAIVKLRQIAQVPSILIQRFDLFFRMFIVPDNMQWNNIVMYLHHIVW